MYFFIRICDELLYEEAKGFFLQQGRSDLLVREPSSLIGAYLITQYMWKNGKTQFSFTEGNYSCEELFFSASHSEDMIGIAIDTKKVAIDLEYIRERDESLLQNVHIPDSQCTQRENFYLQRCAKECIVKYLELNSEEIQEMSISAFLKDHHFETNDRIFDSIVLIDYRGKEYPVHTIIKDGKVVALLHEREPVYGSF